VKRKSKTAGKSSEAKATPPNNAREQQGLVGLSRELVKSATDRGAVAISYHVSVLFQSMTSTLPHLHFVGGKRFSRHNIPPEQVEVLGRCNEFLIKLAKPIILSKYLDRFAKVEPELTKAIMGAARERGVEDQYMVPVYGPHNVNGVISFGYPRTLNWRKDTFLHGLEELALLHHVRSVREYGAVGEPVELSAREKGVLNWIAKGKSTSEIAEILGISASSVDTYTRRIFEKMSVHDRVSATVVGLRHAMISID